MDTLHALAAVLGGLAGALAAAAGTIGSAWMLWRRLSLKIKLDTEASALSHYEGVVAHFKGEVTRQQQQIDRQDVHLADLTDGLEQLRQEHAGCQSQIDSLYHWAASCHEAARRLARRARQDPDDPDVVPHLPPRPPRTDGRAEEFRERTLRHNTEAVKDLSPPPQQPGEGI